MLNHVHSTDIASNPNKRSIMMTRYAGKGSHRYPIGFSGDTLSEWRVLRIMPEFTATACSNELYLWSHDTGGFMWGLNDPELYSRWFQFACWSTFVRLHSHCNPYEERLPWEVGYEPYSLSKEFLRKRKTMIPYIYSSLRAMHENAVPFMAPIYFYHGSNNMAYNCPAQFYYGTQLIVSPVISPRDPFTRVARKCTYLPSGLWFNYHTGVAIEGDRFQVDYCGIEEIPVYAKAGAIVPTMEGTTLHLILFPFGSSEFTVYDDDGETQDYFLKSKFSEIVVKTTWTPKGKTGNKGTFQFSISVSKNSVLALDGVPKEKCDIKVSLRGVLDPETRKDRILVPSLNLGTGATFESTPIKLSRSDLVFQNPELIWKRLLSKFNMPSNVKQFVEGFHESKTPDLGPEGRAGMRIFTELRLDAGYDVVLCQTGEEVIIGWNTTETDLVTWALPGSKTSGHTPIPKRAIAKLDKGFLLSDFGELSVMTGRLVLCKQEFGNRPTVPHTAPKKSKSSFFNFFKKS